MKRRETSHFLQDALSLVVHCEAQLPVLKKLYDASLSARSVDTSLLIGVKNLLENLRSALDFCAHAIVEKYSDTTPKKIYFPYAATKEAKEEFEKRMNRALPNVRSKRPDLWAMIIAMQHFSHPGAKWFPEFMNLTNKNKHVYLVPNEVVDGVALEAGGLQIHAEGITLGETGSIETDKGVLRGPMTVTPENADQYADLGVAKVTRWSAIYIEGYGYPMTADEFLAHCVKAISGVVEQLASTLS
ncbi:MAG: hypothetical protein ACJ8NR_11060 [Sulfurifustis sp.]